MGINIFTDGASRGNPGKAGTGVVIYDGSTIIEQKSAFLGNKTNNEAEYMAVISALEILQKHNIKKANLFSDSQFLVKQLKQEYKVKAEKIKPLYNKVQELLKSLEITFNWVPRSENTVADSLANKGIDANIENNTSVKNVELSSDRRLNSSQQSISSSSNSSQSTSLHLDRAFFGQINCLKVQMNNNMEVYFHIGLLDKKSNIWNWIKVKMSDSELAEIVNLLKKENGKCSFFHSFNDSKTQIWCNKTSNSFSIKIKSISKNLGIAELEVLRIILENSIVKMNFK